MVGTLDEAHYARLFEAHLLKEHLAVLVVLHLGDFRLGAGGDDEDFGVLVLDGFAYGIDIGVTVHGRCVIDVADVHHGLAREQEEVVGDALLLVVEQLDRAAGLALLEGGLVAEEQVGEFLCVLVTRLGGLLSLCEACLNGLEVLYLELGVNDFLVAHGINAAVNVDHIAVVEAAQNVEDGVSLADVGQELVAQTFAAARALDQARDIDNVHSCRYGPLRLADVGQDFKPLVRDIGGAEIRLDCTEGEICALSLARANTVEEG